MASLLRQPTFAFATALGVALVLSASGCAAIKATEQPGKKDFSVLTPGTPRTHVIAELGAPDWSDERQGTTTDVFAVKQGYTKTVKAGRALLHGAADVATVGLWEVVGIPVETLADGTDVKLSINYDCDQRVDTVDVIQGEKVLKKAKFRQPRPSEPPEDLRTATRIRPQASTDRSDDLDLEDEYPPAADDEPLE